MPTVIIPNQTIMIQLQSVAQQQRQGKSLAQSMQQNQPPPEAQGLIPKETWNHILMAVLDAEMESTKRACCGEMICCICCLCPCIFLCHGPINMAISTKIRQVKFQSLNTLTFGGNNVVSVGEMNSVIVNTNLIPGVGDGRQVGPGPETVVAVVMDRPPVIAVPVTAIPAAASIPGSVSTADTQTLPASVPVIVSAAAQPQPGITHGYLGVPGKKSLLIGINYTRNGSQNVSPPISCIDNVNNIKSFIIQEHSYGNDPAHMVALTDDVNTPPQFLPTRANMLEAFRWLVTGARPGDRLLIHYCGRSSSHRDEDGEEVEAILPMDHQSFGSISDEDLYEALVEPLPTGVRLVFISDCIHTGSILDLPFEYKSQPGGGPAGMSRGRRAVRMAANVGMLNSGAPKIFKVRAGMRLARNVGGAAKDRRNRRQQQQQQGSLQQVSDKVAGDVIAICGLRDGTTSALNDAPSGAMTYAVLNTLKSGRSAPSYEEFLNSSRNVLKGKYSQVPQLSSGNQINLRDKFVL